MAEKSNFLSITSRSVTFAAGLASAVLALYAGRSSHTWVLIVIIAAWVASPFAALLLADRKLTVKHESTRMRDALHWLMIAVSVASLLVYLRVTLGQAEGWKGRAFVLVPAAASIISGAIITVVALMHSQPRRS